MKKTIGVIFGGKSVEHDVSIITAHNPIIDSLLATQKYEVVPIYISKEGDWYSTPDMNSIEYFKSGLDEKLSKLKKLHISVNNGFEVITPGTFGSKKIKVDIVFPAMHGTYGEDGSLPGLLRMANVPFVGCDLFASAVAMDKVLTKQVIEAEGIPTPKYEWFTRSEFENVETKSQILDKIKLLKYPLFVKPVHLGSSIGISKVKEVKDLVNAIEVALHYDDKVLVEEGVENLIEVTLPIMGNDNPILAHVERPLNKTEFFDFEDKYMGGGKKTGGVNNNYSEIPAKMDKELLLKVQSFGIKTYKTLGCSGIARIDFLINSISYDVFVNEVNTLPGSLYQHNWKKSGVSNIDLVEKLVGYAEERLENQKNNNISFDSMILHQYKGTKG